MRITSAPSDPGAGGLPRRFRGALGRWVLPALLGFPLVAVVSGPARADVTCSFADASGEALAEAVIAFTPISGPGPALNPGTIVIDQIDKEYVPRITAIVVGTAIRFPNQDDIRHHVYSMSDAKKFELPLYEGTPADPVIFDKPGAVSLGCNIHDWMRAYIYVFETPYFAVSSEEGVARLDGLPAGEYDAQVWHPQQKGDEPLIRRVSVGAGPETTLAFELELKRKFGVRRAPRAGGKSYR